MVSIMEKPIREEAIRIFDEAVRDKRKHTFYPQVKYLAYFPDRKSLYIAYRKSPKRFGEVARMLSGIKGLVVIEPKEAKIFKLEDRFIPIKPPKDTSCIVTKLTPKDELAKIFGTTTIMICKPPTLEKRIQKPLKHRIITEFF